jgi:hypothetical protein
MDDRELLSPFELEENVVTITSPRHRRDSLSEERVTVGYL